MNKYLKLFGTKDEFITCLNTKISGNNDDMGFPNVSVIGTEDNNGDFSISAIYYIKDLNEARYIYLMNTSHWVNSKYIHILIETNDYEETLLYTVDAIYGTKANSTSFTGVRFPAYDWYDKNTKTTYYAYIYDEGYELLLSYNHPYLNMTDNGEDANYVGVYLLEIVGNHKKPNPIFSDYQDDNSPYTGRIIYLKDTTSQIDEIYQRTIDNNNADILIFGDIEPFEFDGYTVIRTTRTFEGRIEGNGVLYVDPEDDE